MFKWGQNCHFIFKSSNPQNPSLSSFFLQLFGGFLNPQIEVEAIEWPLLEEFKILMDLKTHLRLKTLFDSPLMSTTRNMFCFLVFNLIFPFFVSTYFLRNSLILFLLFFFFLEEGRVWLMNVCFFLRNQTRIFIFKIRSIRIFIFKIRSISTIKYYF